VEVNKKNKTPEQIADDEQRTTPLGLFNTAIAYWSAAEALEKLKLDTPRKHAPVRFLYFHALELYLKSFLRVHGYSLAQLEKLRHDFSKIVSSTSERGLNLMEEDKQVLLRIASSDMMIRARYIRTGAVQGWLPTKVLNDTCRKLHQEVGDSLKKKGILVRL
jgi:hypothetical protein